MKAVSAYEGLREIVDDDLRELETAVRELLALHDQQVQLTKRAVAACRVVRIALRDEIERLEEGEA